MFLPGAPLPSAPQPYYSSMWTPGLQPQHPRPFASGAASPVPYLAPFSSPFPMPQPGFSAIPSAPFPAPPTRLPTQNFVMTQPSMIGTEASAPNSARSVASAFPGASAWAPGTLATATFATTRSVVDPPQLGLCPVTAVLYPGARIRTHSAPNRSVSTSGVSQPQPDVPIVWASPQVPTNAPPITSALPVPSPPPPGQPVFTNTASIVSDHDGIPRRYSVGLNQSNISQPDLSSSSVGCFPINQPSFLGAAPSPTQGSPQKVMMSVASAAAPLPPRGRTRERFEPVVNLSTMMPQPPYSRSISAGPVLHSSYVSASPSPVSAAATPSPPLVRLPPATATSFSSVSPSPIPYALPPQPHYSMLQPTPSSRHTPQPPIAPVAASPSPARPVVSLTAEQKRLEDMRLMQEENWHLREAVALLRMQMKQMQDDVGRLRGQTPVQVAACPPHSSTTSVPSQMQMPVVIPPTPPQQQPSLLPSLSPRSRAVGGLPPSQLPTAGKQPMVPPIKNFPGSSPSPAASPSPRVAMSAPTSSRADELARMHPPPSDLPPPRACATARSPGNTPRYLSTTPR